MTRPGSGRGSGIGASLQVGATIPVLFGNAGGLDRGDFGLAKLRDRERLPVKLLQALILRRREDDDARPPVFRDRDRCNERLVLVEAEVLLNLGRRNRLIHHRTPGEFYVTYVTIGRLSR